MNELDPNKYSRIRSLNFSSDATANKSGEYILNQIYMQKKLSQSKNVNSKRTHPSNNLSQNNENVILTKKIH